MRTDTADVEQPAADPAFQYLSLGRKLKNNAATVVFTAAFLIAVVPLLWVLVTLLQRGLPPLLNADWWNHSFYGLLPSDFGGGIYHALVGTIEQALVCALFSVPLGVTVGIFLIEYGQNSRLAKTATFMVDILSGLPSIVAGLFIYALWITTFGFDRSGFAVSLSLVLLMLPLVVRTTETMLRIVPDELREASYALGVPKWKTILKVVLPTALSGIVTGVMLGLARIMGETAPLLILVGYSRAINFNLFEGPMASLPLTVYTARKTSTEAGEYRMWGAALTLVLLIMLINLLATLISKFFAVKTK
ncbi:phosphate ABC transporter membrane protein 2 (PhoT family) [Halopolyspora algeriensis]|uniref:Phosphate transport system permease protein PstA n=1 Tax=Halopolyspora algeriensis TaxID=1500506 RepID=A0A368W2X2_9ACTN|nr:phosphate ABC transporter permease PstA [Halopolyspora algeriensis]RCW47033.1 phosphate ABC transporter membrane protein 2 (PhoT family) [Halopolyspora algeriensis]TQM48120.1 phosphate ABC transporter membrane protein 2 (PhoT family) [Halopolyspora algeriensis]